MLLLTSLAFGSSGAVEAYAHLPADEEELLKHRAQALLQIPREKRIPLLVQEIKRLVTQRRRHLATVDPKRLASVLKGERGAMVEVVLSALPVEVADAARAEMGNPRPIKLARDVKPEILSIIRWKLEDAMRQGAPQVGSFRFTDLLTLQQRDILAVADRMGARVLATAIAGLNDADRAEFLGKLPPDQKALALRASEAGAGRRLTEKDARLVLEMHAALENPSQGMRSAGVQRIARACVAQSPDFAQRISERFQGQSELGKLLVRWVKEERGRPVKADGGRLDIVEQLERLAQKNIIDRPMRLPPPVMRPPIPPAAPVEPRPSAGSSQSRAHVPGDPRPPGGSGQARAHVPGDPRPPGGSSQSRALVPGAEPRPSVERPQGGSSQSRALVPPPRRPTGQGTPAAPARPEAPRRDPIATREARKAGVPVLSATARPTDSQRAQVLRDGKPLEPAAQPPQAPAPRRPTSVVQEVPRRKDPAAPRSPVVKGGPGRGPKDGSR
jgi:hypothetical protein